MALIKKYATDLINSLTSLHFYHQVKHFSLVRSVSFFLVSYLIISSFVTARFITQTLPRQLRQVESTLTEIKDSYPTNLGISWNGQQLSLTPNQPLNIPYPQAFLVADNLPSQLAVIVPNSITNPSQVINDSNQASLLVVSADQLYVSDLNGHWNQIPLKDLPGFEQPFLITHQNLPAVLDWWHNQLPQWAKVVKILAVILIPFGLTLSRLWGSLFNSFLIYWLMRLLTRSTSYLKLWQLCLYVTVVAEIIFQLTNLIYPTIYLPMFAITFWCYLSIILITTPKQQ